MDGAHEWSSPSSPGLLRKQPRTHPVVRAFGLRRNEMCYEEFYAEGDVDREKGAPSQTYIASELPSARTVRLRCGRMDGGGGRAHVEPMT